MEACTDKIEYSNESLVALYRTTKDNKYIEMLYNQNIGLFRKLAKKYCQINWMYEENDILNELYCGLLKSIEYYKPDAGQFFPFLYQVCDQYIWKKLNQAGTIELAKRKKEYYISIYKVLCSDNEGGEVTLLDTLIDEVESECMNNVAEAMFWSDVHTMLDNALASLPKRSEAIVRALNGYGATTLSATELSEIYGVNRSRIHEIKSTACRSLRQNKQLKKIFDVEFKGRD